VGTHQPVVVCGHNHQLRRILAGIPGIIALGWVQDMPALMRSSAIAVLNSGGLALAETAAIGLPVLYHRPLPGQGELNARVCRGGAGTPLTTDAVELAVGLMEGHVLTAELGTVDPIGPVLGMMRELERPIAALRRPTPRARPGRRDPASRRPRATAGRRREPTTISPRRSAPSATWPTSCCRAMPA